MATDKNSAEMILSNRPNETAIRQQPLSDSVIIEIVHAFKDIIIEFINRKYSPSK